MTIHRATPALWLLSVLLRAYNAHCIGVTTSYVMEPFDLMTEKFLIHDHLNATLTTPLFGEGALRVSYNLNDNSAASISDILNVKDGMHNCIGATHLSLWFRIEKRQAQPGSARLRLILADGSACLQDPNACNNSTSLQYFFTEHDILDSYNNEWMELKVALPDDNNPDVASVWTAITPNDEKSGNIFGSSNGQDSGAASVATGDGIRLGTLKGWKIELIADSQTSGVISFDQLACEGGSDMISAALRSPGRFEDYASSEFWQFSAFDSPNAEKLSNISLGERGQLRMEYFVEQREDWGGYTEISHIAPRNAYYNLSSANYISFNYEVPVPASEPSQVHLRFILKESSDCSGNCTKWERYYSFNPILDEATEKWKSRYEEIELRGDGDQRSPFWLPGWSGGTGNRVLDPSHIKGFTFELSIDADSIGDNVTGEIIFSNLRADLFENENDVIGSTVVEEELEFDGTYFEQVGYFASRCKSLCSADIECRYGYIFRGRCFTSKNLTVGSVQLRQNEYDPGLTECFWTDTVASRGNYCEKCSCNPDKLTIDCRGRDLKTLPKNFTESWLPKILDLRSNPHLVMIGKGAFGDLPNSIVDIHVPQNMMYISPNCLKKFTNLKTMRFEDDESQWESSQQAEGVTHSASDLLLPDNMLSNVILHPTDEYSNVCCHPGENIALEFPPLGLSFCERLEPNIGADAEYQNFIEAAGASVVAQLTPGSAFMSEAAGSPQLCAEYCAINRECNYFNYDDRSDKAEATCYLLRDSGVSRERRCCKESDNGKRNGTVTAGWVYGWPPQTRRVLNNAKVIVTPMQVTATKENGYSASFRVNLGSMPKRGAVWVVPSVSSETNLEVSISPKKLVFYDNETIREVVITVTNAMDAVGSIESLMVTNAIESCDVAFSSLSESEILENNVTIEVILSPSFHPKNTLIVTSLVGALCVALIALVVYATKRKEGNMMWSVSRSELRFDDPPICVGQGSFGRVLLAEYRGTMVAVKRVIPPRNMMYRQPPITDSTVSDFENDASRSNSLPEFSSSEDRIMFNVQKEAVSDIEKGTMNETRGPFNFETKSPRAKNQSRISKLAMSSGEMRQRSLTPREHSRLKTEFIAEMKQLSKMRHPCITTVMGAVVTKKGDPMLVMEYMDHGSLYSLLHNETVVIEGELLLPILRDIAQGLRFLHAASPPVVHGDLKSANCLVDSKFRCKVADFGLSQKKKLGANGTPYWMAPELLRNDRPNSPASDVYSFGVTLYEVYSREDPYDHETADPEEILRLIVDPEIQKRPPVPRCCPPKVCQIMAACLAENPADRPTFKTLDEKLKAIDVSAVEPGLFNRKHTKEQDRTNELLFDVFPRHIAECLRDGKKIEPESRDVVTIFFADIVGFTTISSTLSPIQVSDMLDRLYNRFDALSRQFEVFKVETVGDCWMGVTNLVKDQPEHAKQLADFSIATIKAANETLINLENPGMGFVNIRVGLHSGPVVANVVGSRNPRYCLFGDTVNTASRMESNSRENCIHCSEATASHLKDQCANVFIYPRGLIKVKGKGEMYTYWIREQFADQVGKPVAKVEGMQPERQLSDPSHLDLDKTVDTLSETNTTNT